jgi:hypothetical protein
MKYMNAWDIYINKQHSTRMSVQTCSFFSGSTSLQSSHPTDSVFLTTHPIALESFLEASPTGCPYSFNCILILGMLGVLENMSSNLVIPLPFLFLRVPSSKSVHIDLQVRNIKFQTINIYGTGHYDTSTRPSLSPKKSAT